MARRFKRFILLLADGTRPDVMAEELALGNLPHIARHLIEPGGMVPAVTSFPSTTGPAYIPLLTGCWPGTANVPGIRWLDRDRFANRSLSLRRNRSYIGPQSCLMPGDLAKGVTTLFEIVPGSYNVFNIVNRGIAPRRNWGGIKRLLYWYYAHLTDHWYLADWRAGRFLKKLAGTDFQFAFIVFPGVDEYSHLIGPHSSRTRLAYRDLDRAVGEAARELDRHGRLDETCFMIVSDHGLSATTRHFPLNQFLERQGLKTFYYPKIFRPGCQAAGMVSGNAMGHVYLAKPEGWRERWSDEELLRHDLRLTERFVEEEGVDLVLTQALDGEVVVRSRRGEARIRPQGSNGTATLSYTVKGNDPFGYGPLPRTLTLSQVLELTYGTDYPDGIVQVMQLFRSRRTGDIVLSAAPGHDLRLRHEVPEHKGSHGSLHKDHMLIPFVSNAPIGPGPVRSADVFPTLLDMAGLPIPLQIDGRSHARHED